MKSFRTFLIRTASASALLIGLPAHAGTTRVVGLPKAGDGKAAQERLVELALKLNPGDGLEIFDARDRVRIAAVAIPDDPKLTRLERRLPFLVRPMQDIKRYTDAMPSAKPNEPNLIHTVAFLDEVGAVAAEHPNQDIRALVLGSAWFSAPGATSRAEYRGTFPSDGSILDDRSDSTFGTRGMHDLTGVPVSYCYTEAPNAFLNPVHRQRVERAWGLEVAQRGGSLVTFTGDQKSCWDSFAGESIPPPRTFTIDPDDARMRYMYRPEDTAPRIMSAPPVKSVRAPTPAPDVSPRREAARFRQRVSTTPPARRDGPAWAGIAWTDPIDLDLYARCSRSMPFLYFGNNHTAEGRHNFDYRSSTGDAFETVDLLASCPDIAKAEVFVNFYSGTVTHSPKGTFAIEFAGKFYKADFEIEAKTGNGARGLNLSGDMGPPAWARIDLAKVLGFRPANEGRSSAGAWGPLK